MRIHSPFITFTARMIAERNFSRFVDEHDLSRPEAWHYLPDLLGRMVFLFEGLDESTPPLENAALRQFLNAFHLAWPHWSFFCSLEEEDLRLMVYGSLQSVRVIDIAGQQNWALFVDRDELNQYLGKDFEESAKQLRWSGYSKRWIDRRIAAVKAYFRGPLNISVFKPREHSYGDTSNLQQRQDNAVMPLRRSLR